MYVQDADITIRVDFGEGEFHEIKINKSDNLYSKATSFISEKGLDESLIDPLYQYLVTESNKIISSNE